ncbi:Hypothetical protein, putative [Bodo saltans]|uniref:Uncharacterized protein n=1 Tax=Bodo saltans TaxID=75058 RepID=A0A0S4JCU1_BODSA|nr:Hypothetical protein, putative [Bodo saltans]|eukprot:CUG87844.1 Hypothetical protein, putative [Bodo saltans]
MLRFHPDDRKLATELLTMEWLSGSSEAPPSQSPRDNLRGVEEMSYEEMLHSIHIMCGTSIPEHCFELPYSGTQHR